MSAWERDCTGSSSASRPARPAADSKTPRGTVPPDYQLCRAQSIFRLDGGPSGQEEHTRAVIGPAMGFVHQFEVAPRGPPHLVPNPGVETSHDARRAVLAAVDASGCSRRSGKLRVRNVVVAALRPTSLTGEARAADAPERRLLGKSQPR